MRRLSVLSAVVAVLVASPAFAQEKIENGEFTSWNKFKMGTSVIAKVSSSVDGKSVEGTVTVTLVDVGPDLLVLERSESRKESGTDIKMPSMRRDIPKTITLPKGAARPPAPGSKPEGAYAEGTETLKVGGTEVKTKWYKVKGEMGAVKSDVQMWVSDDVPGMMVKIQGTTSGALTSETRMEVVEVKKP